MTEQVEQLESSLLWQKLTPKEASEAVFGGYSHLANNTLVPLNNVEFYDLSNEQLEKHKRLAESLATKGVSFQEVALALDQKSTEQAVRLTAQWLKEKIEEKIRKNLDLPFDEENPAQIWFNQAEEFYFLEKLSQEDRQTIKEVLKRVKTAWGNLEALADPEREIKANAELIGYPGGAKIFDFREQLTLPR